MTIDVFSLAFSSLLHKAVCDAITHGSTNKATVVFSNLIKLYPGMVTYAKERFKRIMRCNIEVACASIMLYC